MHISVFGGHLGRHLGKCTPKMIATIEIEFHGKFSTLFLITGYL
jgi:hypothetical protein